MIRDSMLSKLNEASGSTLVGMASDLGSTPSAESIAALEIVLFYCSDVHSQDGKWSVAKTGRTAAILAAIDNFATSTGRKIFRVSSALQSIPPHEQPTETELQSALEMSHGRYELLPNAMIKKVN